MSDTPQEMMTISEVCIFFGGTKALDKSTIYRWVREKRIPPPLYVGPLTPRWRRSELQKVVEEVAAWRKDK